MKQRIQSSFLVCWQFTVGLMVGLMLYFLRQGAWRSADLLTMVAFFVAYVLFNALVFGILGGAVLSCLIFPFHYFLIKRSHKAIALTVFGVGIILGSVVFKKVISLFTL